MERLIGETLAERYLVKESSYSGECLSTYTAVDMALEIEVDVDVLARDVSDCVIPAGRLKEVLDAAMHVRGAHVFPMHGWGEEKDRGFFYMVREKACGAPLSEVLACAGELPPQQVVEVTAAVVETLAEAYGKGIFYLGVNPGQVWLDGRKGVKLIRVGYGWLLEEMEPGLAARVSPYRAPETDGAKEGSRTSDIYSLAVMVREMLPAGEGGARLDALLARATDPLPNRRPSSPRLLLEQLEPGGHGGEGARLPLDPPAREQEVGDGGVPPAAPGGFLLTSGPSRRPRRRALRNLLVILAGGLALWLVFAAVAGMVGGRKHEETLDASCLEQTVTLPDLQGLTAEEAEVMVEELGLHCTSRESPSRLWSAGRVAAQEPEGGSVMRPGDTVCLVVSSGREEVDGPQAGAGQQGDSTPSPVPAGQEVEAPQEPETGSSAQAPAPAPPPAPAPLPPRAVPAVSSGSGPAPLYVVMDGSASYDLDGSIVRYVWHCGDGTVIEGVRAQHVYDPAIIPARFQVVLEVYDSDGMSDSSAVELEVY